MTFKTERLASNRAMGMDEARILLDGPQRGRGQGLASCYHNG